MNLPMDVIVLGIEIDFGDNYDRWRSFIENKLNLSRSKPAGRDAEARAEWIF
jgi:hypothetical protein